MPRPNQRRQTRFPGRPARRYSTLMSSTSLPRRRIVTAPRPKAVRRERARPDAAGRNASPRLFIPIMVGATLKDRVVACIGAIAGIGLTGIITQLALGHDASVPLLMAPLGASAVLVFAVPASPLAQPWPVIGGNTISALVGVAVLMVVPDNVALAAGLAVGLAIAVMSLTRTLHPPGGAVALTTVIGGAAVHEAGFSFAFAPVCINSALLAVMAWMFHHISGHSYPHVAKRVTPAEQPATAHILAKDVDAAVAEMGDAFDINRNDLDRLLLLAERNARTRLNGAAKQKP